MGGVVEKLAFPVPPMNDVVSEEVVSLGCGEVKSVTFPVLSRSKYVSAHFVWLLNRSGHKFPCLWYRVKDPKYTIIYSHGNAEDIMNVAIQRTMSAYAYHLQVDVFSYEYSGYSW